MSTEVKEIINERTTAAIEHWKRTGGIGSKQTDPLTEDEVRYVVAKVVGGAPENRTQRMAMSFIMQAKNRRAELKKNPDIAEIDCEMCGRVQPIENFKKDGRIRRVCSDCVQRYSEKNDGSAV